MAFVKEIHGLTQQTFTEVGVGINEEMRSQ